MEVIDQRQHGRVQSGCIGTSPQEETPNSDSHVTRAENLAMIGELSAARQALESVGLAPGNERVEEPGTPTARKASSRETL